MNKSVLSHSIYILWLIDNFFIFQEPSTVRHYYSQMDVPSLFKEILDIKLGYEPAKILKESKKMKKLNLNSWYIIRLAEKYKVC